MKISNFRNYREVLAPKKDRYEIDHVYQFADVDITTGTFFKKTVTRQVCREPWHIFWKFTDRGELTPGYSVERMADADKLQRISK